MANHAVTWSFGGAYRVVGYRYLSFYLAASGLKRQETAEYCSLIHCIYLMLEVEASPSME